jgi:hypothetical protein
MANADGREARLTAREQQRLPLDSPPSMHINLPGPLSPNSSARAFCNLARRTMAESTPEHTACARNLRFDGQVARRFPVLPRMAPRSNRQCCRGPINWLKCSHGVTVSDETVKYSYWVLLSLLVSDYTVNYRPVFSSERTYWKQNNVTVKQEERRAR